MAQTKKTEQYNYILDWINEGAEARRQQNGYVERSILAYQGQPQTNYYRSSVAAYAESVFHRDHIKGSVLKEEANAIPEKKNFTYHNAVETVVASTMGGVGQYSFGPYDPDLTKPDKVIDRLSSAAKHFYDIEKIDAILPQYIRGAVLGGEAFWYLRQENGRKCVVQLDSSHMLQDPKRFRTNKERFIGFSQPEGFSSLKSKLQKTKTGVIVKTLNEAEVYLSEIKNQINAVNTSNIEKTFDHEELGNDLDLFYRPAVKRFGIQKAEAEKASKEIQFEFNGDDIEVSYIWDLITDYVFEVVNRKYIVSAKPSDLHRSITHEWENPVDGKKVKVTKEVRIDHPFVKLPYMNTYWDKYSITPLFYVLDDFDSLCSMESVLYHNLSVMAPITFVGQSSDAEKVSRVASVSGEVVEGLPQTFGVLNKTHDLTPIMTAITRYEDRIKRIIKATDPMEMQAMIGDRASAKEVVSASGQVSQGLNPFIANIEAAMADLGNKFIKMEIIFGKDKFSFVHNGKYAELNASDVAGDFEVRAKLASSIKLEQESNARKALELIQYMGQSDKIDDKEFFGVLMPIVLSGFVNRQQARNMIAEKYRVMDEETMTKIKARAEADAAKNPIDKMNLNEIGEEELDAMIAQISQNAAAGQTMATPTDVPVDAGTAMPADPNTVGGTAQPVNPADVIVDNNAPVPPQVPPQGAAPEAAGEQANEPTLI